MGKICVAVQDHMYVPTFWLLLYKHFERLRTDFRALRFEEGVWGSVSFFFFLGGGLGFRV